MRLEDRYVLGATLGEGALSIVRDARERATGREVAIKLFRPGEGTGAAGAGRGASRLHLEGRALCALRSPHVVEVIEVGVDDGRPFVVMERLFGEDLRARLAQGPMPWPEALAVALGAARGLAVAHEHGIVHRDLKPANLFLTREGVKLLDFGSAKVLGGALEGRPDDVRTAPGDLVGSPRYMSPEQARGRTTLDPRTDVFSLGLVLYEALVGVHPYDEVVGLSNLILALCTEPPLPLAMAAPHVPPSFAHVVERALAIDPGTRPADGGALLAELERVADALPDTPTALPPATTA